MVLKKKKVSKKGSTRGFSKRIVPRKLITDVPVKTATTIEPPVAFTNIPDLPHVTSLVFEPAGDREKRTRFRWLAGAFGLLLVMALFFRTDDKVFAVILGIMALPMIFRPILLGRQSKLHRLVFVDRQLLIYEGENKKRVLLSQIDRIEATLTNQGIPKLIKLFDGRKYASLFEYENMDGLLTNFRALCPNVQIVSKKGFLLQRNPIFIFMGVVLGIPIFFGLYMYFLSFFSHPSDVSFGIMGLFYLWQLGIKSGYIPSFELAEKVD